MGVGVKERGEEEFLFVSYYSFNDNTNLLNVTQRVISSWVWVISVRGNRPNDLILTDVPGGSVKAILLYRYFTFHSLPAHRE